MQDNEPVDAEDDQERVNDDIDIDADEDAEEERGDGIYNSIVNKVPLPMFGISDERYVLGTTGRWYSREDAIKEGDVKLTTWIDQKFSVKGPWYIDHIVDERTNTKGENEYLVKFTASAGG